MVIALEYSQHPFSKGYRMEKSSIRCDRVLCLYSLSNNCANPRNPGKHLRFAIFVG
jgi:hypothetical protein